MEREFLTRFFNLQRLQWENYAQGAEHNLAKGADELYTFVSGTELEFSHDRRGGILKGLFHRIRVDQNPSVAALRNKLDNSGNYPKSGRAEAMGPDVLKLMALRNTEALNLGYKSYTDLVFSCEELDYELVRNILDEYLSVNLPMAKHLQRKYNIRWSTWFSDLSRLGLEVQADALGCAEEFVARLGLGDALSRIAIVVKEQQIFGVTLALDVPDDVRILVRPVDSLAQLMVLYHEIGHGLGHALNTQTGIYKTWTAIEDETRAIAIERIGQELLPREQQQQARDLDVLEKVRCAVSFLFEMDLYRSPQKAEELYRLHYCKLVDDPGDGGRWSLDSFRSIDSVYIYNYVLGSIYADRTVSWLKSQFGHNPTAWGVWLKDNWFAPGRSNSLQAKLKHNLRNEPGEEERL